MGWIILYTHQNKQPVAFYYTDNPNNFMLRFANNYMLTLDASQIPKVIVPQYFCVIIAFFAYLRGEKLAKCALQELRKSLRDFFPHKKFLLMDKACCPSKNVLSCQEKYKRICIENLRNTERNQQICSLGIHLRGQSFKKKLVNKSVFWVYQTVNGIRYTF